MPISRKSLMALNVAFWILLVAFLNYNLYRKYQSLAVCQAQLARLDAIEVRIDNLKR